MRKELDHLCRRIENEVSEIKKIKDLALRRCQFKNFRTSRFYDKLACDLVFDNGRMMGTGFRPRHSLETILAADKRR